MWVSREEGFVELLIAIIIIAILVAIAIPIYISVMHDTCKGLKMNPTKTESISDQPSLSDSLSGIRKVSTDLHQSTLDIENGE